MPDLSFEIAAGRKEGKIICGVDEVGRGPLAGPVMAAAAILPADFPTSLALRINDSKKMTVRQRDEVYDALTTHCRYAVAEASITEIKELNILWAAMLAMQRAVEGLGIMPDHALIDGNRCPRLACPAQPIVKGDGKSLSIAAASIIAKVSRDRLMARLAEAHPGYGWEHNAGYGTPEHLVALKELGPTIWHRDSFAPVRELINAKC